MNDEESIKLDCIWIDVVKAIATITKNDSDKVKSLAESIKDIKQTLNSCEISKLLDTNRLVCSRFPEIIFAQNSGIFETSKETVESQPISVQRDTLRAMGILLYRAIQAEKTLQAIQETGKIIINQTVKYMISGSFGVREIKGHRENR